MKIHLIFSAALVLAICATLGKNKLPPAKVTEFGIYPSGETLEIKALPSSNTGVLTTVADAPALTHTTEIPGELGITFGYCYEIPTERSSEVITRQIEHPPMIKPGGTISTGYSYEVELDAEFGSISYCTNYVFEHSWEIAFGVWIFSIHQKGQKILEQQFNVYKTNR